MRMREKSVPGAKCVSRRSDQSFRVSKVRLTPEIQYQPEM